MVKVELSWTFEKTNDYPSYKCVADIKTITQDGTEFSRNMNIKGDSPDDCINLIFRNEHFTPLLKALTKAALPEDTEEKAEVAGIDSQRDDFYNKLNADLQNISYGELRKFVSENELPTKIRNGGDKKVIAANIIKDIKQKELDEKDN